MSSNNKAGETLRLIRCEFADETYVLDMSWVKGIYRLDSLRRIPKAKRTSADGHDPLGWLPNDEGDVPVFSLAKRLGRDHLTPSMAEKSERRGDLQRIIELNPPSDDQQVKEVGGGRLWALLVDGVSQVIQVPADSVIPLPIIFVNPAANYFNGVVRMDEELVLLLSPERLHPDAPQSSEVVEGLGERRSGEANTRIPSYTPQSPTARAGKARHSYGQIVVFSVDNSRRDEQALSFGLSISQVPEILEPLPTIPVPGTPAFVLGLLNWRDRPVPLIDLSNRLGLTTQAKSSDGGDNRLIIAGDVTNTISCMGTEEGVDEGGSSSKVSNQVGLVGFIVQPSIQVLRLPIDHQPCRRPLPLDNTKTRGIFDLEDETLVIPDIRSILQREG
jgi:purine-binding chemotaxis protein CheW